MARLPYRIPDLSQSPDSVEPTLDDVDGSWLDRPTSLTTIYPPSDEDEKRGE